MYQVLSLVKSFSTEESFAVFIKWPIEDAKVLRTAGFLSPRPATKAARILPVNACNSAIEFNEGGYKSLALALDIVDKA